MKRYRLTKLTVKTREVISLSQNSANEKQNSLCPVCRTPLIAPLFNTEFQAIEVPIKPLTNQLTITEMSGEQEQRIN